MGRPAWISASLLCLALAGCGGYSTSSPTSTTTASTPRAQHTDTTAKPKPEAKKQRPRESPPAPKAPSGPAPTDPNPLPNQGTKAVAPRVPTSHGGDNSIQRFGTEAESSERVEVALIAKAYLDAQANERWAEACSYLNAKVREGLETLAAKAKDKGIEGCAGAMAALLGKAPAGALRKAADIQVLSFRVEGDLGFVVYRDGNGDPYNLPLHHEGGEWKVGALAGIGLVL